MTVKHSLGLSDQAACFATTPRRPLQYGAKQRSCSSYKFLIMTTLRFGSNRERLQQSALRAIITTGTKQHLQVDHHNAQRKGRMECPLQPEKVEIFRELNGWAEDNFLPFLRPVEKSWQPQDFLPDPSSEEFLDRTIELKERAAAIPDDYYVCLAGNLITEEALPSYQTAFNTFHGVNDNTGASPTAWARWSRGWTAEENRHGDLLNTYLYLTGRLDMRQVQKTIQYLISAGMNTFNASQNPFCLFIYVCFQEQATFISHGNTARHAKQHGDLMLAKICGTIAADEKRHAAAYTMLLKKLFEVDPDETMQSLAHIMRMRVTMPANSMFDGRDPDLFSHFSAVEQRLGVYTARDYGDILEFFLKEWQVEAMGGGLSSEGRRAQDYVCSLPRTLMKLAERVEDRRSKEPRTIPFSWIFNKPVAV